MSDDACDKKQDDAFLERIAISNSISAALGRNSTYRKCAKSEERKDFRRKLEKALRIEARRYVLGSESVTDIEHCNAILGIQGAVKCHPALEKGHLKYGAAQKSFNLYLKFLWQLGKAAAPPHCPIDRSVLQAVGIGEPWTRLDCKHTYLEWINKIRKHADARKLTIAEWEYKVWLKNDEAENQ